MNPTSAFSLGFGALRYRLLGRRMPLNVMLSVTNRCNSRCRYCDIPARRQRELSPDQVRQLIDEMAAAGTKRLGLWGGEPLLRDDIADIVHQAKSHGMYVTLDTNGYLLPQRLPDLPDLDHVIVAYDGPEHAHDANRGKGTWRKAMAGIEAAMPRMTVWTITVLTRHNIGEVAHIVETGERLGFVPTFQILHHNDVLGRGHEDLLPTNDEYRSTFRRLRALKRAGKRVGCSERFLDQMLHWGDFAETTRPQRSACKPCLSGKLYCNVDTDGAVYGCSLLVGLAPAKSFLGVGFRAAFDAIPPAPCQSCVATCFTDYNCLFALDLRSSLEWMRWMWMS